MESPSANSQDDNSASLNPDQDKQKTSSSSDPSALTPGSTGLTNLKQVALNAIHSAGTWSIVLGVLNVIFYPLLEALLYTKSNSGGYTRSAEVVGALIVGLIIGGIFIGIGIRLKRTTVDKIKQTDRVLLYLGAAVLLITILSFIAGGRGVGLLDLLVLFQTAQARQKIKKIGTG